MAIKNKQGIDLPNSGQISEWQDDEYYYFTQPKPKAVRIQVNPGLRLRKIYLYLACQRTPQQDIEFFVRTLVRFVYNGQTVGSFPHCIGSGGKIPVSQFPPKSLVSVASGIGNTGNATDMISVTLAAADGLYFPFQILLCPQIFYGEFDTIEIDIQDVFATNVCRLWCGCMSSLPTPNSDEA